MVCLFEGGWRPGGGAASPLAQHPPPLRPAAHLPLTQTLNVTASLCLCDCPGLVLPQYAQSKAEMVAAGALPVAAMLPLLGGTRPGVNLSAAAVPSALSLPCPPPHCCRRDPH